MGHGQTTRPELIREVVKAYGSVQPNLKAHDPRFPAEFELAAKIHAGQPIAGPHVRVAESIGQGKDPQASAAILRCLDRDDPRPLWIAVWGGTADLAQALWRARQDRPRRNWESCSQRSGYTASATRISSGSWLKNEFPGLFYITRKFGYRGMYRGGDTSLCTSAWVNTHIKGHGALGDLYPDYNGGDIWSSKLGPVLGIKEGDTPSYLGLIQNGLNPLQDPFQGDWGVDASRGFRLHALRMRSIPCPGSFRPCACHGHGIPLAPGLSSRLPGQAGLVRPTG